MLKAGHLEPPQGQGKMTSMTFVLTMNSGLQKIVLLAGMPTFVILSSGSWYYFREFVNLEMLYGSFQYNFAFEVKQNRHQFKIDHELFYWVHTRQQSLYKITKIFYVTRHVHTGWQKWTAVSILSNMQKWLQKREFKIKEMNTTMIMWYKHEPIRFC